LEAKRAKLEEERRLLGDDGNVLCSSRISEAEINKADVSHPNKNKETEAPQRLRRRDIHHHGDGNLQSVTDDGNPGDPDPKVDKLKCETDLPESKHRSDYSVLFKIFGLFVTFSSLGFFMTFK